MATTAEDSTSPSVPSPSTAPEEAIKTAAEAVTLAKTAAAMIFRDLCIASSTAEVLTVAPLDLIRVLDRHILAALQSATARAERAEQANARLCAENALWVPRLSIQGGQSSSSSSGASK